MSNYKVIISAAMLAALLLFMYSASATDGFKTTKQAAEQGDASAQFNLGFMYDLGEGVPENDAEAVRLFRLAAEQGYAEAQHNLGLKYARGEGVPEDDVQAYAWFSLAATQGQGFAQKGKNILAKNMTREQIAEAQKLSQKYWESYGPDRNN